MCNYEGNVSAVHPLGFYNVQNPVGQQQVAQKYLISKVNSY